MGRHIFWSGSSENWLPWTDSCGNTIVQPFQCFSAALRVVQAFRTSSIRNIAGCSNFWRAAQRACWSSRGEESSQRAREQLASAYPRRDTFMLAVVAECLCPFLSCRVSFLEEVGRWKLVEHAGRNRLPQQRSREKQREAERRRRDS